MNNIKGSLILLLVAFIWGTAFVAQTSGAGAVGTFTFNAARSIVGALFLAVVIIIKNVLDKRNNSGKVISTENGSRLQTWPLGAGIICGIVLFAAMTFQQYGISVYPQGVAASGRSGFITATYVVMVSVVSVFMGKKNALDNRRFCCRMRCRNVSFMYVWWCIRNISWRCPCVSGSNMLYNTHSGY